MAFHMPSHLLFVFPWKDGFIDIPLQICTDSILLSLQHFPGSSFFSLSLSQTHVLLSQSHKNISKAKSHTNTIHKVYMPQ